MSGSVGLRQVLGWMGIGTVGFFVLIQAVPYGRGHENPPITREPKWDSPATRELAARACFDCHSNESRWPWYSHVAPTSWFVQKHVDIAREELNFSEWQKPQPEAEEAPEAVLRGKMPMTGYLWFHERAKLTEDEKRALIEGLRATLESEAPGAIASEQR